MGDAAGKENIRGGGQATEKRQDYRDDGDQAPRREHRCQSRLRPGEDGQHRDERTSSPRPPAPSSSESLRPRPAARSHRGTGAAPSPSPGRADHLPNPGKKSCHFGRVPVTPDTVPEAISETLASAPGNS